MRARTFVFLAGVAAGAYLYYSGKGRELIDRIREATAEQTEERETEKATPRRERTRRTETKATTAKTSREIDHSNDDLPTMLDDVVHRDDIPETPVKQAFEQAVHDQAHH